jgi:hypothetical protein
MEMNMARKSKLAQMREELALNSKVKTVKQRKKRKLTEEQKAALVDRMAKARAARGPAKNLSIHESIRTLGDDHFLSPSKVKDWIKTQKDLLASLKEHKDSKDKGLRSLYWQTETYITNLQKYLNTGVYLDNRYGDERQGKISYRCTTMAYYADGTPKRTVGVWYPDIGQEYTTEMASEDYARAKRISNKK